MARQGWQAKRINRREESGKKNEENDKERGKPETRKLPDRHTLEEARKYTIRQVKSRRQTVDKEKQVNLTFFFKKKKVARNKSKVGQNS